MNQKVKTASMLLALTAIVGVASGCEIQMRSGPGAASQYQPPPYQPGPYQPPPPVVGNVPPPVVHNPPPYVPPPPGPKTIHIPNLPTPIQSIWGNNDSTRALRGLVYFIPENTPKFPDVSRMQPQEVVYTNQLNIPLRDYNEGFMNDPGRLEWFAIRYEGKFQASQGGTYNFATISDDGTLLYIDGKLVIDNDGIHAPIRRDARIDLAPGEHTMRVDYFQALRWTVALQVWVRLPGHAQDQLWGPVL